MRILLLADSHWRDALGIAFLKCALQQYHPNTFVASFDVCMDAVRVLNPHVVVLNHIMGRRNKLIADYVKRQGGLVVVLPTEGRPNSDELMEWYIGENNNPRYLDLFLSWNDIISLDDVPTRVVGCPRFDIYQHPSLWGNEKFYARYSLPRKSTLLFTSSFPAAKFSYRNRKFNKQDSKDLGINKVFDTEERASVEYERLQRYMLWVRAVANEYGDRHNIVVKPHPMEDVALWRKLAAQANITLVEGDYMFRLDYDLLIGRAECLTHQDAWLMGQQSIMCHMGNELSGAGEEAALCSRSVSHIVDLLDAIYYWREGYDVTDPKRSHSFLEKWGFNRTSSAQAAAEAIVSFVEETQPRVPDISHENYAKFGALLKQHAAQNARPSFDGLGHFGKAVTSDIVDNWCRRINAKTSGE